MVISRVAIAIALASLSTSMLAAAEPPPGAASCSGCHPAAGTVDSAVPPLAGRQAAELVAQMQAFKTAQRPATVMDRIAKGFSDSELAAIAAWYAEQK